MRRSSTYRLGYNSKGNIYSAEVDRQRFLTLEYNLDRYIGIIGNGILNGWDITSQPLSLIVTISPGSGIIDGYYSETPYYLDPSTGVPKTKDEAEADGDTIIEELDSWSSGDTSWEGYFYGAGGLPPDLAEVLDSLGPSVDEGVIVPKFTDPPDGYLDNPYVKAETEASVITLSDNSDNYVYAENTFG
jgi:hypothetical protein